MHKRKFSREEFDEYLKVVLDHKYPQVKYQNPDSCIADFLKKHRRLRKGEFCAK
jgi:hypothetical protein